MAVRKRDLFFSAPELKKEEIIYIMSYALKESKERILASVDEGIDEKQSKMILSLIEDRKKGKPMAYITGRKEFFSLEFTVNECCLIPRPETELLVEEAERVIRAGKVRRILDMGTGSGIIGITLAKRTSLPVLCIDISKEALFVAKRNAQLHGVEKRVLLLCSDLFSGLKPKYGFDLVLANLPYVSQEEWMELPKDVRDYEPKIALWGGRDGLEVMERFVDGIERYISHGGTVLMEFGHERQGRALKARFEERGFEVEILKDLSGTERILKGVWKN